MTAGDVRTGKVIVTDPDWAVQWAERLMPQQPRQQPSRCSTGRADAYAHSHGLQFKRS